MQRNDIPPMKTTTKGVPYNYENKRNFDIFVNFFVKIISLNINLPPICMHTLCMILTTTYYVYEFLYPNFSINPLLFFAVLKNVSTWLFTINDSQFDFKFKKGILKCLISVWNLLP